jgi:hypothetical protein
MSKITDFWKEKSIKLSISLFSGFLQRGGSEGNGLFDLENEIHHLISCYPEAKVRLYPWNVNVSDVAESVWRLRNSKQSHIVVGYSYGGQAAANFTYELQLRSTSGLTVPHLFLCDPVRRWKYLPGVAAMTGLGTIRYADIVDNVTYYYQANPRWKFGRAGMTFQPAGHKIKGKAPFTPIRRIAGHSYIDNDKEFKNEVLKAIKSEL